LTDKRKREKINQIIKCQEGIAMASEVMSSFTKEEIEYYHNESKLKYELDMQSMRTYYKQQGLKKGEKMGVKKGEKKGVKKGVKKIIDLLKSGKSPEEIIKEYE